jgi:natural product biosynthesis luciferase-like monooxygenase protein/amino acid adenylation domain-containing protein/FkbM family methyltransferase
MKDMKNSNQFSEDKQKLLALMLEEEKIEVTRLTSITPRDNPQTVSLSFAQERLWFLEQLNPQNAAYNIPVALRIGGRLDITVLDRCLNKILQRHETLRSKFTAGEGQSLEIAFPEVNLSIDCVNFENFSVEQWEASILQHAVAEAQTPFNFTQDTLVRAKLLCRSTTEHVLLLTMHHAVADGWSLGVLVRELATLYQALSTGQPAQLPELPIQYADFAVWQRQQLQGEVLETQLNYWREQLGGSLPVLDLPTDRPRPTKQTFRGAKRSLNLSKPLLEALKDLSQQQGGTLFMTLLTAFKVLLYRYTGQEDILVGSPVAGRDRLETEHLIGLFVNVIVLRTDLSGNPTFRDLLDRVREVVVGAYNHQEVPFEKLVEILQPERDLSYSPLFQVMFALQNTPMPSLEFSDLTLSPLAVDNGTAKFDLTLDLAETPDGIDGSIEYNTDLFDDDTIARMVGHLQTLLEGIVANPDRQLSDLPLLTPPEQHQILVEWNDTQVDYPIESCLHHLFELQVQKTPDAIAVVFEGEQLSYHQLNQRANQLAHYLQKLGVEPEVRVGICVERSIEMVVGLLGILKAGGSYIPLDPHYPQERLAFMLADAQVPVLLTQTSLVNQLPQYNSTIVCLDEDWETICQHSCENPTSQVLPTHSAYIIYTSGSTGQPKGVVITHHNTVALVAWAINVFTTEELAGVLASTSICFDLSVFELFVTLSSGGKVILVENALELSSVPTSQVVTLINTVPSAIAELLRVNGIPATVSTINLAGEPLPLKLVEQLYCQSNIQQVFNLYGPSEDTTYSTFTLVKAEDSVLSIGRPINNTQVYVLDRYLKPMPIGVPGELYIGGDGLASGYLNRPELTTQKFIRNPFNNHPDSRLYRTGDLVRYLPNGNLEYLGRLDHQVKIRGFRIELGEIEALLRQHPDVRDVVVVAREDRLVAYLAAADISVKTLRSFLGEKLPEFMIPAIFMILDTLPLTPNGKLDRRSLPVPEVNIWKSESEYVAPRTVVEEVLAAIWSEILGLEKVGIKDNFFALGGHSLLATQVISRLREAFQVELPLRSLFAAPTVADLSEEIDKIHHQATDVKTLPILTISRDRDLPLSFAQSRLWFLNQLDTSTTAYNITEAIRMTGLLNVVALHQSLNEVVQRHESLRTTFTTSEGQPSQVICPNLKLSLPIVDLSRLSTTQQQQEIQQLVTEEIKEPFDLIQGPLLQVKLLQLGETAHLLLLSMHHIISDGWSMGILIREIAALYEAYSTNQPSPLPELSVQYADFAVWQRQWLQGETLDRQLAYWKQQLACSSLLDLPTDRPRPAVQTFIGHKQAVELPKTLLDKLKTLSQREGVTLFMTLLAAFKVFLHRYSQQDDIIVGSPIANRNRKETEPLIGIFVNTLVLRTDLGGNPSFSELLQRVREVTLDAYAYQDLPFEKLVEELQPERDLSRNPLFGMWFSLNNSPMPAMKMRGLGLTLNPLEIDTGIAQFDLSLNLSEEDKELIGAFEYNSDLFNADTITSMRGHFQTLLEGIVSNPDRHIEDLPLLSQAEQHQLLLEWNNTQVDYPTDVCIHDLFAAQVQRSPDAVALVFQDEQLTYRELDRQANCLAHHLQKLGVTSEMLVGVYMERSLHTVVGILGILKAGGAYLPLDPAYPLERLTFMLEDAQVSVLLTQERLLSKLSKHQASVVCLDRDWQLIAQAGAQNLQTTTSPDNLAYEIYTSGSTGKPKGVMVAHRHVVNFFTGMDNSIGGKTPGTWLATTSISFDISVLELIWTLTRGFKVVIGANPVRTNHSTELVNETIDREMAFSLFYFASDDAEESTDKYRLLLEGAKFADRHGFTAIWTPERHFNAFGGLYPNPSVIGAAIASVTERIQIRAGSVVLPLQNPIRVAEEWSVVDNLSHGRVGVSFASGWHADDFVLAPENYQDRFQIMCSDIETVRQLWCGEAITLPNGSDNQVEVKIHPQPIQPELPIWVTAASSPETFRMAGHIGANVLTHLLDQSIEELAEKIAIYRQSWQEGDREPEAGRVTLMIHTFVGEDLALVREKVRQPFCQYLKSSLGLLKNLARSLGWEQDIENLTEAEEEQLVNHAFERYFETSSLLGDSTTCWRTINKLKAIGVDEVGCLIDFGVDCDSVLSSLHHLNTVKELSNQKTDKNSSDYSLAAQMTKHSVSHLQCTPSMVRMLLSDSQALLALGKLDRLMLGGEALPVSLAEQLSKLLPGKIYNMYGPTETTIWSATYPLVGEEGKNGKTGGHGGIIHNFSPLASIPIGRPIANTEIYILDNYLHPVPVGIAGELYIGGVGVVRGYWQRPELTAERFIPNPFGNKPGERLYKTGDLARYLPNGNIEFLGRVDNQVKIQGYRIELGEIEAVLSQHPAVLEAVVVARDEQSQDKLLVAYIVPKQRVARKLRSQLTLTEEVSLFTEHKRYTLPNGMVIASLSDLNAIAAYKEVIEDEIYLKHGIAIREGDCIFDVGANIGLFTLFVNQKFPNLQVYAFEPIPPTFKVCQANVKLYGLDVKLFPLGVSHQQETAEFTFYPEMSGLSGRYSEATQDKRATKAIIKNDLQQAVNLSEQEVDEFLETQFATQTYTCQLTTLSEAIAHHNVQKIDLLKIDVEKAEFDVLRGIKAQDWQKIQQIVIEVDTKENLDKIVTLLEQKGFHLVVDDFVIVETNEQDAGIYVYMLYATRIQPESDRATETTATLSTSDLRGFLKARLPEYMMPSTFVTLDAMPLTPNGKIDRQALPAPTGIRPELEVSYVVPKTEVERAITAIWKEILQVEKVGIHDNFFDLGGTSLKIVQARTKLREELAHEVSLVDLFKYPTINSLAKYLNQEQNEQTASERVEERAKKQKQAIQSTELINRQKQFMEAKRQKN